MAALRRTLPAALALLVVVTAYRVGRAAQLGYGATPDERRATLPGDEITPDADLVATRATTVDAPPAAVWPWLVQMGQGRAGFYSYERLENLARLDIHNADEVVPEWQGLAVGDPVRLAPEASLRAAVVDRDEALVLHGAAPAGEADTMPFDFTWAFVLRPVDDGARTRLLVRERYVHRTRGAAGIVEPVSWLSLLMTGRMLRGIRERAERGEPSASRA